MRLIKGLAEDVLIKKIRKLDRLHGLTDRCLGFYLLDFNNRGLFKKCGFSSTAQFALVKLHVSRRRTRELLRIARELEGLPLLDKAFSEGRLSWSAVREITRVATKETETEWIALAEEKGIRQIERAVSRVNYGDRPPEDPYSLSKTRIKVVGELLMADYAVWETAFDRLRERCGHDLDFSTALVLLSRSFLEQPLKGQEKESRKAFQVIYHRCSECAKAWMQTSDGVEGVPRSLVESREIHAEVHVLDEGDSPVNRNPPDPGGSSSPPGPGGAPSPVVPKEERDIPNSPGIRRHVLNRDGHVCARPGCGNRGTLFAHHVTWRSLGGRTVPENEICVCKTCHELIHEGLLRVEGRSPDGLEWFDGKGKLLDERMNTPGDGKNLYRKEYKAATRVGRSTVGFERATVGLGRATVGL